MTRFLLCVAGLVSMVCCSAVYANDCTVESRELLGIKGLPKVREHVCKANADGGAILRVAHIRLDEPLAGSIILDDKWPELDGLFGKMVLVKNEVFDELTALFAKFGRYSNYYTSGILLNIRSQVGSAETIDESTKLPGSSSEDDGRKVWSLTAPFDHLNGHSTPCAIPLSNVRKTILVKSQWPKGFKHHYGCEHNAILCTRPWAYLELGQLGAIEKEMVAKEKALRKQLGGNASMDPSDADSKQWGGIEVRFDLLRYIGQAGLPKPFMVISGEALEGCGALFEFTYHMPFMSVDVAVIENTSATAVKIDQLLGVKLGSPKTVRKLGDAKSGQLEVGGGEIVVPAGTKAIVPLRVVFSNDVEWASPKRLTAAQKMYKRISSQAPGTLFTQTFTRMWEPGFPKNMKMSMAKEAFLPPETPDQSGFVFGREYVLAGFTSRNRRVAFQGNALHQVGLSRQFSKADVMPEEGSPEPVTKLRLHQNFSMEGSCPILYAQDPRTSRWIRHGKTIHEANGAAKEGTSAVIVDPAARVFMLTEEEPEVAFIRAVKLHVTLNDGRSLILEPTEHRELVDGFQFIIHEKQAIKFSFSLSKHDEAIGVAESKLHISGYYQRYAAELGYISWK